MPEAVLNYQNVLEIDTTPSADNPTWARIGAGFKNVASSINEVLYQASYLSDEGYGSSEVTGGQLTFSLTGDRVTNDPAQNYIFSSAVRYNFGNARKTHFRITHAGGEVLTGSCTIAKADVTGGDSNTTETVAVDIHINGKPTITSAPTLAALVVVSVAGSTSGKTAIYVNPAKESANSYKYKTGASVTLPSPGDILTTSGIIAEVVTDTSIQTFADATALGASLLQNYGTNKGEITFNTTVKELMRLPRDALRASAERLRIRVQSSLFARIHPE